MSISGIATSNFAQSSNVQQNLQQAQSKFKQLGQDLQSGDLSQAQADFLVLSQSLSAQLTGPTSGAAQSPIPVRPNAVTHSLVPPHAGAAAKQPHPIALALSQLGQALQSGSLSVARQAYSTMQSLWQDFMGNGSAAGTPSSTAGISVKA